MHTPRLILAAFAAAATLLAPAALAAPAGAAPVLTAFAGTGRAGGPVPGAASASPLDAPQGVAEDAAGDLYIADTANSEIEKVTPAGTLSVLAGTGTPGPPTPGPATRSELSAPSGVAVDLAGNVFVADTGNAEVEEITPAGQLSVIAGTGSAGAIVPGQATASPLGAPTGVAVDGQSNLYVADATDAEVLEISSGGTLSVLAGTGTPGQPTPGPATASPLERPTGVAVDASGNVYLADPGAGAVLRVAGGTLAAVAGAGTASSAVVRQPAGVAVDGAGDVFIADPGRSRIDELSTAHSLLAVAGNGTTGPPSYGGSPTASALDAPQGVAVNSAGTVFIADSGANTVDRVGASTPSAPDQPAAIAGDATAELYFAPPVDPGLAPISGYQVSLDGGVSWQAITTSPGPGQTLSAALGGLSDGTAYTIAVRALNGDGAGMASPTAQVTPQAAPSSGGSGGGTGAGGGSGSGGGTGTGSGGGSGAGGGAGAGSGGSGSGSGSGSGPGSGSGSKGSGSSGSSSGPTSTRSGHATGAPCPAASGHTGAGTIGPLSLGLSRAAARARLSRFTAATGADTFCLAGGPGLTAVYSGARSLDIAVLATAEHRFSLDGAHAGERAGALGHRLAHARALPVRGGNWYVIVPRTGAAVLIEIRHGRVAAIGLSTRALARDRAALTRLLARV